MLINVPNLVTPYYTEVPDPSNKKLAGETIETVITQASGNGVPIGGLKVVTQNG
jgi:phosphoglucomutase